ncbi:MAG: dual specificity protein phosphatase family protein [Chloroflexi bacterium]|nr:dual specificity protein phosphatase family protein [Chloroflexota bacterium]
MAYTDFNWIIDRLAVGGFVRDSDDLPFDAILSMETHAPTLLRDLVRSGRVEYQWRSILDGRCDEENDEIVRRFDAAAAQMDAWLRGGRRVLVHCFAGVSRSVTAVIWYLMRYRGYSWEQALELIKANRPGAYPDVRFEIPLRLAAGEDLSEEWIEGRIEAYCAGLRAMGWERDPSEIWEALEQQGTFRRERAAAG